jgi:hypothetical protein
MALNTGSMRVHMGVVMFSNRSVPPCTVIPVLSYPRRGRRAADWLCNAFGFPARLLIANYRSNSKQVTDASGCPKGICQRPARTS